MLKNFIVIKLILSFIIPYITLYAIYIQLNGEVSPGGGFQAGVIFATAIIGYELVFGKENFSRYSLNSSWEIKASGSSPKVPIL